MVCYFEILEASKMQYSWLEALFLVFVVVFYLNFGYFLGRLSWRMWDRYNSRNEKGFWTYILFPYNGVMGIKRGTEPFVRTFNGSGNYCMLVAVLWPLKFFWNIVIGSILLVKCFVRYVCLPLLKALTFPVRKIMEQ